MNSIDWDDYPNFTEDEFRCHCGCGKADMEPDFMTRLQDLRTTYARPITITSGYRCEEYNRTLKGGPEHPSGQAADIAVSNPDAVDLITIALMTAFSRVGVSQRAGRPRFVHIGGNPDLPKAIWSY